MNKAKRPCLPLLKSMAEAIALSKKEQDPFLYRSLCQRPDAYPCEAEQGFATYCTAILGLRKTVHGKTTPNGRPPGYDVAHALFRRQSKG